MKWSMTWLTVFLFNKVIFETVKRFQSHESAGSFQKASRRMNLTTRIRALHFAEYLSGNTFRGIHFAEYILVIRKEWPGNGQGIAGERTGNGQGMAREWLGNGQQMAREWPRDGQRLARNGQGMAKEWPGNGQGIVVVQ